MLVVVAVVSDDKNGRAAEFATRCFADVMCDAQVLQYVALVCEALATHPTWELWKATMKLKTRYELHINNEIGIVMS